MNVLILGVDGYLGWPLAQTLAAHGHTVGGIDAFHRRAWVAEAGSASAMPVASMPERLSAFATRFGTPLAFYEGDIRDYDFVECVFREFEPETVVHLGECPSAPYSMVDVHQATFVQTNNIVGTLNVLYALRDVAPDAHLVKLGTMGEYGTPALEIPEGFFEVEYRGRRDTVPFPRQAGSWYHWSKVHSSNNMMLASKLWDLRITDVMQGVVFGTRVPANEGRDDIFLTRLDFDEAFGTVINRFVCQAVLGHPLTVYGTGGQQRGFLPLRDSMRCLSLLLEQPAGHGEYRVVNQFAEVHSVAGLADTVQRAARDFGLEVEIAPVANPRVEQEEHLYQPVSDRLRVLGYQPSSDVQREVGVMLEDVGRFAGRLEPYRHVILPTVRWRPEQIGAHQRVGVAIPASGEGPAAQHKPSTMTPVVE